MKKKKKSTKKHSVSFPEELMVEILLRLAVKSVVRFKCVCKSWLSLISSPKFAELHFDLAAAPSHRFLLRVAGNDYIESIDPEAPLRAASAVMYLRLPPLPAPLYFNRFFNCAPDRLQVCGSCRGFVLLHQCLRNQTIFIVWNPVTGVHKQIPPDSHVNATSRFLCGFCYDASNDDYLVICIKFIRVRFRSNPRAMIKLFSLKSNSWDCQYIETKCPYSQPEEFEFRTGSFLNGALHWLVFSGRDMAIVAFDLVERSLSEIPLPPVLNTNGYSLGGLRVFGGCLGTWVAEDNNRRGAIWMMEEYKVLSSWTRSFDLLGDRPSRLFSPISLNKDNTLFGLDLYHKKLHKLCGKTKKWLRGSFAYGKGRDFHDCNLQCSLYRESLLSLPDGSGNNPR